MADIITTVLGFFRILFGFLLLLFIPGFAISFIFFPRVRDISLIERMVLSCVISIGSTLCVILFLDLFLGVDPTAVNCSIALLVLTGLVFIIWDLRQVFSILREKRKKRSAISEDR